MKPVLKWAGGKTQLLKYIREMLPPAWNRYFEPFLGGGALLLELSPQGATVNDINLELVNMYRQVRDDVDAVVACLKELDARHEGAADAGDFYYSIRNLFNEQLGSGTAAQGVHCMLTNHNTELVRELYGDFCLKVVPVARNINSRASARKGEEIIVTSYDV